MYDVEAAFTEYVLCWGVIIDAGGAGWAGVFDDGLAGAAGEAMVGCEGPIWADFFEI